MPGATLKGVPERGLSTARAAAQVLMLLARSPGGVRADEVSRALGKSLSTAYNLLASLVDEGVAAKEATGRYGLSPALRGLVAATPEPAPPDDDLAPLVDELFHRTHKRSYLGRVEEGRLRITVVRGLQGLPRIPALPEDVRDALHALALGKVVLSLAPPTLVQRYADRGLRRFTDRTITEPRTLVAELSEVRRRGVAIEDEEFADGFCCVAVPVLDADRHFLAALGVSMSPRTLEAERDALATALRSVARGPFQPCADRREVLDRHRRPDLASPAEPTAVR